MKTAFFGTPEMAVPFLERLAQISEVQVVVSVPDQPSGRGYAMKSPAVALCAQRLGLPVMQPEKLRDPVFFEKFQAYAVDVVIVVAYGKLIPRSVLECAREGFLNVHFSLLPKYRGAAPIQWALMRGETETGVTLFWLDEGMDTGPVFLQEKIRIAPEDDAESLRHTLTELGVRLLEEGIQRLKAGQKSAVPQAGEASLAPLLKKEDGAIDWDRRATDLLHQVRGMTPWPGVYVSWTHEGRPVRLRILRARALEADRRGEPGRVHSVESGVGPVIECSQGLLQILEALPEGKKAMSGWEFWNGARLKVGDYLR